MRKNSAVVSPQATRPARISRPGDNQGRIGTLAGHEADAPLDRPEQKRNQIPQPLQPAKPQTVYTPAQAATATGDSTTVVSSPGATGPAGPSDRLSDAAIIITTTPYTYTPTDANPVMLWVYAGADGDVVNLAINPGTNSAGKKIFVLNGERGGHKNLVNVTCGQGSGAALTDPLKRGGDSLRATVIALPVGGSSPLASGTATSPSGTTTLSGGVPVAVQLRVQVESLYHAEAANTIVGTMEYVSGELISGLTSGGTGGGGGS